MSKTLDFSKDKELIRQDSTGEYIEVTLNVKKAFGKGRLYSDGSMLIEEGHYKACVPSANEVFKKAYRSDLGLNADSDGDIKNIRVGSASGAANILVGGLSSGYIVWKDKKDRIVDFYRDTHNEKSETPKKRVIAEVLDQKPRRKNIGTEGKPLETLVNPDVKQILGDKVHLEEGDELTWYRDANINIIWHTDGSCDLFEREHIGICGAVFRIVYGHWRGKGEHGSGMEPQHWIYKGIKVSDILNVYPNFWKACENSLDYGDNTEAEDNRSYEMGRTSNKEAVDKEGVTKEAVRQPKYYYESTRLKYRTTNSDVQCSAVRDINKIKSQLFYEGSNSNQDTPWKIAEDMIDLLPESVWNPHTKFLDIYCKSGIFLEVIKNTLKDKCYEQYREMGLATDTEINKYIFENQLYGLCWSKRNYEYTAESLFMVRSPMNSYNIKKLSEVLKAEENTEILKDEHDGNTDEYIKRDYVTLGLIKKYRKKNEYTGEDEMTIDVVVGNPPYNKDIYIDFVENGHKIARQYCCFITPAKWQAKGGEKNESFRKNIVPHMSKIVYYPNTPDVFFIGEAAGISAYRIDKEIYEKKKLVVKSSIPILRGSCELTHDMPLDICGWNIINKVKGKRMSLKNYNTDKKYKVWVNNLVGLSGGGGDWHTCLFSRDGKTNFLGKVSLSTCLEEEKKMTFNQKCCFSSDTKIACEAFKAYIYTRLVRFLLYIGRCGNSVTNDETWRFVPDPGAFDHIFTDQELYTKYKLTQEEINVIESVIKERK